MKAQDKRSTHFVVKKSDAILYLSNEECSILDILLEKVAEGRLADGKALNIYWICNVDEPYAEDVHTVIMGGEENKVAIPPIYKKVDGKFQPRLLLDINDYVKIVSLKTK